MIIQNVKAGWACRKCGRSGMATCNEPHKCSTGLQKRGWPAGNWIFVKPGNAGSHLMIPPSVI